MRKGSECILYLSGNGIILFIIRLNDTDIIIHIRISIGGLEKETIVGQVRRFVYLKQISRGIRRFHVICIYHRIGMQQSFFRYSFVFGLRMYNPLYSWFTTSSTYLPGIFSVPSEQQIFQILQASIIRKTLSEYIWYIFHP